MSDYLNQYGLTAQQQQGLTGQQIGQFYTNGRAVDRAQENYNYVNQLSQPSQFGTNTGVSNLGGAIAGMLFKPQAQDNLQSAQSGQAQLLGKALTNNSPTGSAQISAPAPTPAEPQAANSTGPVVASFAPQVGKSSSSGGGSGSGLASMGGGMMGGGGSAGGASAGGGMSSMMGSMSGGGGSSGGSSSNSYTPPPPSFGATVAQAAGTAPGSSGGYANGQTAVHPGTGQQITFRNGGWMLG